MAVAKIKRHDPMSTSAYGDDECLPICDWTGGVATIERFAAEFLPKVVRPYPVTGLPVEADELGPDTDRVNVVPYNQRCRMGTRAVLVAELRPPRGGIGVLPACLPITGVKGDHDFIVMLAVHRIECPFFNGNGGVPIPKFSTP